MSQHPRGFSLLELVMVMAVLAVAALVLLPRWNGRHDRALAANIASIQGALQQAKLQAMASGKPQTFNWNPESRQWSVGPKSGQISANVQVIMTYGKRDSRVPGPARIVFYPDGLSSGGTLQFSTHAQTTLLEVDWLTGQTRYAVQRP